MSKNRKIIEFNGLAGFIVKNVKIVNNELTLQLHEPISPNAAQKFLADVRKHGETIIQNQSPVLFSFEIKTQDSCGTTISVENYKDVTIKEIDFGPFYPRNWEDFITVTFKM